jgi:hypothetical protein
MTLLTAQLVDACTVHGAPCNVHRHHGDGHIARILANYALLANANPGAYAPLHQYGAAMPCEIVALRVIQTTEGVFFKVLDAVAFAHSKADGF